MSIHFIPWQEDRYIIYQSSGQSALVGNNALVDCIRKKQADDSVLMDEDLEELLSMLRFWEKPDAKSYRPDFKPVTAVLLLTNQCNLRCSYCYADAGEKPKKSLDLPRAKRAIDYVCEQAIAQGFDKFRVDFHGGGEPTMKWRLLRECTQYARSKPIAASISLTSNGVWSPHMCEWIIENLDEVSLSVDGQPSTQNTNRPLLNGDDSAAVVFDNLSRLDMANKPYGIRITATAPWDTLYNDVEYLCRYQKCHTIQVEPAFNVDRGGHNATPSDADCQGFAQAFMRAFDYGRSHGKRIFFSGARPGITSQVFCNAPYNALIVNSDGNLTTCYEVDNQSHPLFDISHIGSIDAETLTVKLDKRQHLHGLMEERREHCEGCFCLPTCGGDCYTRTFQQGSEGHLNYSSRCNMNREITREMLVRLIADGDGVWSVNPVLETCYAEG